MKLERIQTVQRLPIQLEEAWDFFTSPKNLGLITPHWLDYRINLDPPEYLHPGTIVSASFRPISLVSMQWVTEITHIRPTQYYITEQRFGPFKMWHHEHYFRPHQDGVEVEDIIIYGMHGGVLGSFFHNLFIRKKLHEILSYRAQTLEKRFGSLHTPRKAPAAQPSLSDIFETEIPTPAPQAPAKKEEPPKEEASAEPELHPMEQKMLEMRKRQAALKRQAQQKQTSAQQQQKPPAKPTQNQPAQKPKPAPQNQTAQKPVPKNPTPQKPTAPKPTQRKPPKGRPEPKQVTLDDIFGKIDD